MPGDELDSELGPGPEEPRQQEGLTGEFFPPDEPTGEEEQVPPATPGGGQGGGRGPTLLSGGELQEPMARTPVRASVPFLQVDLDPIIYVLCYWDSKSEEHKEEYRGLTRSEAVAHFIHRLAFEDLFRRIDNGQISFLANGVGDALMKINRLVAFAARAELYKSMRQDVISTLVQAGVASQERLEELLGVSRHAVS